MQMVSLFWGVPQKEISKVRAFNLSKKMEDKKKFQVEVTCPFCLSIRISISQSKM